MTDTMARRRFVDPVSGAEFVLVVDQPGYRESGVEHADCATLADVSPELDAFFCPTCQRSGRISGAWYVDVLRGDA